MGIDLVYYCFSLSFCHHRSSNKEDAAFDEIIGHIQDILLGVKSRSSKLFFFAFFLFIRSTHLSIFCIDDHFFDVQSGFMEKYHHAFEDSEENKFIYTDIFKQYVSQSLCSFLVT